MFPVRYFCNRYFASRYWCKIAVAVTSDLSRTIGLPACFQTTLALSGGFDASPGLSARFDPTIQIPAET
jgi:hypothetical protein